MPRRAKQVALLLSAGAIVHVAVAWGCVLLPTPRAVDTYRNLASQSTTGIDTQLQWSFPAGPGGLSVSWFISWLASYETHAAPGVAAEEIAGTIGQFGGSYPEWKSNFHVGYTIGGLTMGATWQYIDSMKDGARYLGGAQLPPFDIVVPSYDYFDLEASYELRDGPLDGLSFGAGAWSRGQQKIGSADPRILYNTNAPTNQQRQDAAFVYQYAPEYYSVAAHLAYETEIDGRRAKFQINVSNLLDNDDPLYLSYNVYRQGGLPTAPLVQQRGFYNLQDPRKITFTATFEF